MVIDIDDDNIIIVIIIDGISIFLLKLMMIIIIIKVSWSIDKSGFITRSLFFFVLIIFV